MKKIISKSKPIALALIAAAALAGCTPKAFTQADVDKKIESFSGAPTVIDATFKQKYKLVINDDRSFLQSFAADVNDETTIQIDYSAGNIYYYAKRVAGSSVVEQLLRKEGAGYEYYSTSTLKKTVADDAAAKVKVNELLSGLTRRTAGYVDEGFFNYNAEWLQKYVLLDSENIESSDAKYFTYSYGETKEKGLKVEGSLERVGYFGDMGTFEFGTDATHKGSKLVLETSKEGYILNFEQSLSNHLDMPLFTPPAPLDLEGSRSLVASYNGSLTKKAEITQNLVPGTIVLPTIEHATIASYNFVQGDFSTLAVPSSTVSVGNYVVVKVTPEEGYEVDFVKVNGNETTLMNGYHAYMTPAESGVEYKVTAAVKAKGEEPAVTTSEIIVEPVEHATIETFDFKYPDFSTLATPKLTVSAGNFVSVRVTLDEGYEVESVKVNGNDATFQNGYYTYMTSAVAGTTYTVVVTLKAAA